MSQSKDINALVQETDLSPAKVEPDSKEEATQPEEPEEPQMQLNNDDSVLPPYVENPYADETHFPNNGRLDVHQLILMDKLPNSIYKDALLYNKHLLHNKIVLDVGCGTGILSLFAAKAGAKHTLAVDSGKITNMTSKVAYDNGLDHAITVVKNKIEELKELPLGIQKVDAIVSEWMGFCLFHDSMLNTVLYARDRWLRPGGQIFPDKAQLYLAGLSDRSFLDREMQFWNNVYGFNMSLLNTPLGGLARVIDVSPHHMMTSHELIRNIDLYTMPNELCDFSVPFALTAKEHGTMHGLCAYFNVDFSHSHTPLSISTAPDQHSRTHWHQTVFYLDSGVDLNFGDEVTGNFRMYANPDESCMDFDIKLIDPHSGHRLDKHFKLIHTNTYIHT